MCEYKRCFVIIILRVVFSRFLFSLIIFFSACCARHLSVFPLEALSISASGFARVQPKFSFIWAAREAVDSAVSASRAWQQLCDWSLSARAQLFVDSAS